MNKNTIITANSDSPLYSVPAELLHRIFFYLSSKNQAIASMACRVFNETYSAISAPDYSNRPVAVRWQTSDSYLQTTKLYTWRHSVIEIDQNGSVYQRSVKDGSRKKLKSDVTFNKDSDIQIVNDQLICLNKYKVSHQLQSRFEITIHTLPEIERRNLSIKMRHKSQKINVVYATSFSSSLTTNLG